MHSDKVRGLLRSLVATLLCLSVPAAAHAPKDGTVSLSFDRTPLTTLVAELGRQTGTAHRVDREGSHQLVVAFCKETPASRVRSAISDLLGWSWSRGINDGRVTYSLRKPIALRRHEAALRSRFQEQYARLVQAMIAAAQDPERSPEDGGALDTQVRDRLHGDVLRAVGTLPERLRQDILNGKAVAISRSQLEGPFGEAVSRLLNQYAAHGGRSVSLGPRDNIRVEILADATGRPKSLQMSLYQGGKLSLQFNSAHVQLAVAEGSRPAPAPGDLVRLLQTNPEFSAPMPDRPPMSWSQASEPLPSYIGWKLRDLARRVPVPLLADCYPDAEAEAGRSAKRSDPWPTPPHGGRPLHAALTELAMSTAYTWREDDGWALLRYSQWFWEAARQYPRNQRSDGTTPQRPVD